MLNNGTFSIKEKRHLIASIKRGGPDGKIAMNTIYKNYDYKGFLKLYASEQGLSGVESTDILHDALLIFRQNVRAGKFPLDQQIGVYITSIAKNIIQNERRKQKTVEIYNAHWDIYGVEESAEKYYSRKEAKAKIMKMLGELKPRCQELLKLWQLEYNYDEIAEIMKMNNRQTAKKHKFNCFRKLMELIPKYPELKSFLS